MRCIALAAGIVFSDALVVGNTGMRAPVKVEMGRITETVKIIEGPVTRSGGMVLSNVNFDFKDYVKFSNHLIVAPVVLGLIETLSADECAGFTPSDAVFEKDKMETDVSLDSLNHHVIKAKRGGGGGGNKGSGVVKEVAAVAVVAREVAVAAKVKGTLADGQARREILQVVADRTIHRPSELDRVSEFDAIEVAETDWAVAGKRPSPMRGKNGPVPRGVPQLVVGLGKRQEKGHYRPREYTCYSMGETQGGVGDE